MMKKLIMALVIILFPFISCASQENHCIFINHEKLTLRYSTKSNVEKLLGDPERVQFFERGGEDFFWKEFTVCSYDERKLSFHYDKNGAIIRIAVNTEYSEDVRFFNKSIKTLTREDVLGMAKSFEDKTVYKGVYISDGFIGYDHILSVNSTITYGYWLDTTTGKVLWIDMYYASPW